MRGTDTAPGDFFGTSVAVSGTTMVVGADGKAAGGRAYLFEI
ncbi:MAG: FG-GAP repeat protein [Acidimicrobiales bacterium]